MHRTGNDHMEQAGKIPPASSFPIHGIPWRVVSEHEISGVRWMLEMPHRPCMEKILLDGDFIELITHCNLALVHQMRFQRLQEKTNILKDSRMKSGSAA